MQGQIEEYLFIISVILLCARKIDKLFYLARLEWPVIYCCVKLSEMI